MEFVKKYIHIIAYAVIIIVACAFVLLGGDSLPRPTPEPSVESDIIGPATARVGDLVVLTASDSAARYLAWVIVPGVECRSLEGNRVLVTTFTKPGEYVVIMAASSGKGVSISKHVIKVTSDGPQPDPDVPSPDIVPDSSWAAWTRDTVLADVPSAGRAAQSEALSHAVGGLAAKIAAGAVPTTQDARVQLRAATNQALGNDAIKWAGFSTKFSALLDDLAKSGKLSTLKQYQEIYSGVADGLAAVAKRGR